MKDRKPLVVFVSDSLEPKVEQDERAKEDQELIEQVLGRTKLLHGWEQTLKLAQGRPENSLRRRVRGVIREQAATVREALRKGAA